MGKYEEQIYDDSVWLTATPGETTKNLPFYISEIGHFFARESYCTERNFHNSFLLLYTISGCGIVATDGNSFHLPQNHACIIDCKKPHRYNAASCEWQFVWFHFNGTGAAAMNDILTKNNLHDVSMKDDTILKNIYRIMEIMDSANIADSLHISVFVHEIINHLFFSALYHPQLKPAHSNDIDVAISYIQEHYAEKISIDELTQNIHMSKYNFIRIFRTLTGVTPYSYITAYRINQAKILLRSTDKTIAEIAIQCGYWDTSNFINHFKNHTGETPLQYRNLF